MRLLRTERSRIEKMSSTNGMLRGFVARYLIDSSRPHSRRDAGGILANHNGLQRLADPRNKASAIGSARHVDDGEAVSVGDHGAFQSTTGMRCLRHARPIPS